MQLFISLKIGSFYHSLIQGEYTATTKHFVFRKLRYETSKSKFFSLLISHEHTSNFISPFIALSCQFHFSNIVIEIYLGETSNCSHMPRVVFVCLNRPNACRAVLWKPRLVTDLSLVPHLSWPGHLIPTLHYPHPSHSAEPLLIHLFRFGLFLGLLLLSLRF